jgi:transcriptional regulator with XRE-family HTH domain
MTLGEKLRKLRKERGWKQQEVADRSGVSRPLISYLEQPRHSGTNPTAKTMLRLASVFDIEVEEFFKAAGYITDVKSTGPRRGRVHKKAEMRGDIMFCVGVVVRVVIYAKLVCCSVGYVPVLSRTWD